MWQPSRAQWMIIWPVALVSVLAWPAESGRSLGVKMVSRLVDPSGTLPSFPPPLPMGLDDDGDAVAAHDALETAYYQRRDRSALTRWRMTLKDARDPFDPQTTRQLLAALLVVAGLATWRLQDRRLPRG